MVTGAIQDRDTHKPELRILSTLACSVEGRKGSFVDAVGRRDYIGRFYSTTRFVA